MLHFTRAKTNLIESVLQLLGGPSNTTDTAGDTSELYQDLDLIVLGANGDDYRQYTEQIQKEFSHMDDASYNNMRLRVTNRLPTPVHDCICVSEHFAFPFQILETFLTIPQIYSVQYIRDKYEEVARSNIKAEITELGK